MARNKKSVKIKDKWKQKQWLIVESPKSFGNTPISYFPITDQKSVIGKVLETTLYDLLKDDIQNQTKKLLFVIVKSNNNTAFTILKNFQYSREYVRSLIRRGSTQTVLIDNFSTSDNYKVRLNVLILSQRRITSSKKHELRAITNKIVSEKIKNLTYDPFVQEVILGKLASDIYNACKKITPIRHVGIQKLKLLNFDGIELIQDINSPDDVKPVEDAKPDTKAKSTRKAKTTKAKPVKKTKSDAKDSKKDILNVENTSEDVSEDTTNSV